MFFSMMDKNIGNFKRKLYIFLSMCVMRMVMHSKMSLYSSGSRCFAMQHVRLHLYCPWEDLLMEKNVYSLSTIGMRPLYQCEMFFSLNSSFFFLHNVMH